MKKTLKNIIICISIIFLVLSIGYTFLAQKCSQEYLDIVTNSKDLSYYDVMNSTRRSNLISDQYAKIHIFDDYMNLFIFALCAGFLIGLFLSVKENSIVKYIIFFIFGFFIFGLIWSEIAVFVHKAVEDPLIDRFEIFKTTVFNVRTVVSFTFIYAIAVIFIIIHRKKQVEVLNDTLKNANNAKKRFYTNIPILKIIITIIVILVIIFIFVIARRMFIISKHCAKVYEIAEQDNYYFKEISPSNVREIWHKEGMILSKTNDGYITYIDTAKRELWDNYNFKDENDKTFYKETYLENFDGTVAFGYSIKNEFWLTLPEKRFWTNLPLAFEISITEAKYNGTSCYVVNDFRSSDSHMYLDKNTFLPINYTSSGVSIDYYYEFGNVTDEDVANPIN